MKMQTTVNAPAWFDDYDPRELKRWAVAAAIVAGVHVGAISGYLYVHQPDEIGDDTAPIAVDFSPSDDTVDQTEVAPTPDQPPPPPKVEEQPPPTPPMPARTKGGAPHIEASWETSLVKRLQQFKRYPSEAQSRGEEGVVMLSFSVDRNGRVLAHKIVHSSGYPALDAEVTSMIERAQPLPAFPPSMTQASLDLTVPIRFSLR